MSIKHTEDFKLEAVRIALSSGLPRAQIAGDLGVGKSTLSKWISVHRPSDMPVAPQADLAKENERHRGKTEFFNRIDNKAAGNRTVAPSRVCPIVQQTQKSFFGILCCGAEPSALANERIAPVVE
jgi:transposase